MPNGTIVSKRLHCRRHEPTEKQGKNQTQRINDNNNPSSGWNMGIHESRAAQRQRHICRSNENNITAKRETTIYAKIVCNFSYVFVCAKRNSSAFVKSSEKFSVAAICRMPHRTQMFTFARFTASHCVCDGNNSTTRIFLTVR